MRSVRGGSEVWFVPEAYGNRSDPDPVRVKIRYLSERQKRALALPALPDQASINALAEWYCPIVAATVLAVENYGQIKTAADLVEFGEAPILIEVGTEIARIAWLGDAEGKASAESSTYSGAASPTGTVGPADPVGSRLGADAAQASDPKSPSCAAPTSTSAALGLGLESSGS